VPEVHLVSFYTEGSPHDQLQDLSAEAAMMRDQAHRVGLRATLFSPRLLLGLSARFETVFTDQREYVESHPDFCNLPVNNPAWSAMNFFLWKPELICMLLHPAYEAIAEGDLIFYHDSNTTKSPTYLRGIEKWDRYVRRLNTTHSINLFLDNDLRLGNDVKPDLLNRTLGYQARRLRHIWAGAMVFRKCEISRLFVDRWLSHTRNLDSRAPVPMAAPDPDLLIHSQDQACLSVTTYQWIYEQGSTDISLVDLRGSRRIPPRRFANILPTFDKLGYRIRSNRN